jgi:SAM-dependent methyltransferase
MFDISRFSDALSLGADGIWHCPNLEVLSYPLDGNQACFQIEDSSFWFNHRNACIASAVQQFPPHENGPIFDIGGGNGFVSLGLMRAGFESILVEPGPTGASNGKARGVPTVICATTSGAEFRRSSLPAIGLFDVVEHIENDLDFLKSMRNLLQANGRLYVTVPAYSALWSLEDEKAGHFRRYTRMSISALCERAGFRVEYSTYIFRPLPLPILLLRALPYRLRRSNAAESHRDAANDHRPSKGVSARVLRWVLGREVRNIASMRSMSFGGSCLLVASAM